jgi:hypothetical protein
LPIVADYTVPTSSGAVPTIGSFAITPPSVASGGSITLTASNVGEIGGSVDQVSFYQESNGTPGLQIGSDTSLGDGTQSGTSWSLTASTVGLASGDYTYYAVATDSTGASSAPASATESVVAASTVPTIADAGFETPAVGSGYVYNPSGTGWTFTAGTPFGSGVAGNGSAFTSGNPAAPQGTQVAFLQATSTISQSVAGWSAGTYTISFSAAQRENWQHGGQNFQVLVDGAVVGTFMPSGIGYATYSTDPFTVTAGAHTITFQGLDSVGGDNTAFIDNVQLQVAAPVPTIADSGFESPYVGNGYLYDPTSTAWVFTAGTPFGSGVTGNGSGFTAGNPAAPEGMQVAFLQETSSITQTVSNWQSGSYVVSFSAAQRENYQHGGQNFELLVDGVVVGIFNPSSTNYETYTSSAFTVTAGTHTISFVGLDSVGGDNTAFIDNVQVNLAPQSLASA